MRHITIESFPNRELRVVNCREQVGSTITYGPPDETDLGWNVISEPTCHSLKTLNAPTKPRLEGKGSQSIRSGYGALPRFQKFSTYGRRTLLRAGGALEDKHPHHECLFLTLTHPGSTKESMEVLARWSGFAVQRLKAWLGKRITGNLSMYTWEWQRRGALHLHYVVHCPDEQVRQYVQSNLKAQWIRILDAISQASGIDIYRKNSGFSWASNKEVVRVDCQVCEKSVAAYLSKYISKATDNVKRMPKNAFCPSRWYGVSRPLLALLRERSFKITLTSMRNIDGWQTYDDCLSILQSFAIKCYEYRHVVGDGKTAVGYVEKTEQDSIWTSIMNNVNHAPNCASSTELRLRSLCRNGVILLRKHKNWFSTFARFCNRSRPMNLMSSPSFKDISRSDLIFLLDMLLYSFRYEQRTRLELPGECQLWYSQVKEAVMTAPSDDLLWMGNLDV
jgi:hypothetical protein